MTIHDKPAVRPLTNALTQAVPRDPKQIKTGPSELDDRSAPVGSTSSNGPPSVELNTNISKFSRKDHGFPKTQINLQ